MQRNRTNRRRDEPIVDALPEFFPYRDDGCEVSPSCLECPLPQCKYDDPEAYYREQRSRRDREVVLARLATGASVPQLARRFGLSQRTIHRIFARSGRSSTRPDGHPGMCPPKRTPLLEQKRAPAEYQQALTAHSRAWVR